MNAPQLGVKPPPHDPAALAREILSQPRFRVRVSAPQERPWWDAIRRWLADRWSDLANAFAQHVHFGRTAGIATGDVLIVLAIALVVVILVRLLLGVTRENLAAHGSVTQLAHRAGASALHAAACETAREGAYAAAIALLFRAALERLDARGLLRDDPARTVNQCRRDVRARASRLSAPFDSIARTFTAAVYAEDRITPAHWSEAEDAYRAFAAQADGA